MNLKDIVKGFDYSLLKEKDISDTKIRNIDIDSRNVTTGSLFVCIKGLHVDGHDYIKEAIESGAAAVMVEAEVDLNNYPDTIFIKVADTKKALSYSAASFYQNPAKAFNLIGVTGTNGKTSVTYFMEAILKELDYKIGIIGTVETRIGQEHVNVYYATSTTPDTVELQKIFGKMRDEKVDHVVMEVSSHALELNKVEGVGFNVGIFTNLTQDHLDFHGTMDKYCEAKAKLFTMSNCSVINIDDPASKLMIEKSKGRVITYSIDNTSDLQAKNIVYSQDGIYFDIEIGGETESFSVSIPGRFTVYNVLSVIGASLCMDIPFKAIKNGLKNMKGVPGRIQSIPNDKGFSVFVDYAHTPDSVQNIISAVRDFTTGRVITVFGCGGDRDKTKRPIMGELAGSLSDFCIITSDNPRTENPTVIIDEIEVGMKRTNCEYEKITDRKDAINLAIAIAKENDSIIIAGKGHENYQIFADGTVHFDDWEEAQAALLDLK